MHILIINYDKYNNQYVLASEEAYKNMKLYALFAHVYSCQTTPKIVYLPHRKIQ